MFMTASRRDGMISHGHLGEPDLRRAGGHRVQWPLRLHMLSPAVRVQSARGSRAQPPSARQCAQRRGLAPRPRAGDRADRERGIDLYFRADAAFAKPELYELLEAEGIRYAIRLPANRRAPGAYRALADPTGGRPPNKPQVFFASFSYQAQSWRKPRRVVAKVEWHRGELYPRVGFIVTNLTRPTYRW